MGRWASRLALAATMAVALFMLLPGLAAYYLTRRIGPMATELATRAPVPVKPLRLRTSDGVELGAWYAPASPASRWGVVLVHGNRSRRSNEGELIALLSELDAHVLAVTVRAHGDSEGTVNDFGFSAQRDVVAGFEALGANAPGVQRFILGRSLGAAAALFAAETLGDQVAGYVLESPYASLEIATKNRLGMGLPSFLIPPTYAVLEMWAERFLPVPVERVAPERAARHVPESVPVVLLAGAADRHATLEEIRRVRSALPGSKDRARWVLFEGAAHGELLSAQPRRYRAAVQELLQRPEENRAR